MAINKGTNKFSKKRASKHKRKRIKNARKARLAYMCRNEELERLHNKALAESNKALAESNKSNTFIGKVLNFFKSK